MHSIIRAADFPLRSSNDSDEEADLTLV